ncbi:hypothetical protein [Roseivirga echinicomitans]|uniref:Uncharacterized protein n=1 Tax=Roseivirga echinicomitans TaxID=296218 RepID=A0A150XEJ0_9BACT|nr:hypothetical protein [Roseivirga echinicomitans]KYG77169.1 hypothetical protein AWN68_18220 [Roseivirga echinicomitans]
MRSTRKAENNESPSNMFEFIEAKSIEENARPTINPTDKNQKFLQGPLILEDEDMSPTLHNS